MSISEEIVGLCTIFSATLGSEPTKVLLPKDKYKTFIEEMNETSEYVGEPIGMSVCGVDVEKHIGQDTYVKSKSFWMNMSNNTTGVICKD